MNINTAIKLLGYCRIGGVNIGRSGEIPFPTGMIFIESNKIAKDTFETTLKI